MRNSIHARGVFVFGGISLSFKEIKGRYNGPNIEEEILKFWNENDVFQKTIDQAEGKPRFSFNEGPPTANGKPGIHHVLARSYKDVFPRYKTMQGYQVLRKAGWDTHGLPVEHEVEKDLGIFDKKEILDIKKFILNFYNDKFYN